MSIVHEESFNSDGLPVQPKPRYCVEKFLDRRDKYFVAIYEFIRQIPVCRASCDAKLFGLITRLGDQIIIRAQIERGTFSGIQPCLQHEQTYKRLALTRMQLDDDVSRILVISKPALKYRQLVWA